MKIRMNARRLLLLLALWLVAVPARAADVGIANGGGGGGKGPAVYLKLVAGASVPFESATVDLMGALRSRQWKVVADFATSAPAGACSYRSEVLVAVPPAWTDRVMVAGQDAAFAVPIRFVVWEDETGVNVGATNPMNLARTIVDEETAPDDWADIAAEIRAVATAALPNDASESEYGQHRDKARIGRTMGVMAGGKFTDKIKTLATVPGDTTDPSTVAHRLADAMADPEGEWGTHVVYVLDLAGHDAALVGVTGAKMEAEASGIVKHGGDDARKKMACPGIDHAAAFPIELLVTREGPDIRVALVDEMYRMKMFFEDAGKMAFMKHMGMPGSIEGDIRTRVERALH